MADNPEGELRIVHDPDTTNPLTVRLAIPLGTTELRFTPPGTTPYITVTQEGQFYIHGRLIDTDLEIYNAFRRLMGFFDMTPRPNDFTASAIQLANAVIAGHHDAAYALADEVFAHAGGK